MCSKKDYEAIAGEFFADLNRAGIELYNRGLEAEYERAKLRARRIADGLAAYFKKSNPNFNEAKFLIACGYPR